MRRSLLRRTLDYLRGGLLLPPPGGASASPVPRHQHLAPGGTDRPRFADEGQG